MIKIIAVGKIKEKALKEMIGEYQKRLQAYTKFEIIEVKDYANYSVESIALNNEIKEKEGTEILIKIKERDSVVLVDLHGVELDSLGIAKKLDDLLIKKRGDIILVIAGSLGFGKNILRRSDYRISLGKVTYPHQLVRLLVVEQLYRSYKIMRNENYHK